MAQYRFLVVYDDRRQVARVTNIPDEDGYVCGYDILFRGEKDKRSLKEGLTAIIVQKSKPPSQRGQRDLTPVGVARDIATAEEMQDEIDQLKEELRLEREKNERVS
jgi:hypothetical protein